MDANRLVTEILRQDAHATRRADESHFFQLLRAAFERDVRPPSRPDVTKR